MKKRTIISWAVIAVAALLLAMGMEMLLDYTVNRPMADGTIESAAKTLPGAFHIRRFVFAFIVLFCLFALIYAYRKNDSWHRSIDAFRDFLGTDPVWAFLVSVAISVYLYLYRNIGQINSLAELAGYARYSFWPVTILVFAVLYGGIYVSRKTEIRLGDWLYQKRWILGLCLLAICVFLNLNISSLHEWAGYLESTDNGVLLGQARGIRSDEWAKTIGMLKALGYEGYPVFSNLIRATATENVLIAGHVAWDISALFRPLTWGFLIFGSTSFGLSFNHFGSIILLFLLSFDFFMIVSENRKLSFAFACAFFFSPFVQWWSGSCFELLFSSFAVLVAAYHYLTAESVRKKILSAFVAMMFAGNFVLTMYPAWMIPGAYFMLAGLIWIILDNRRSIRLKARVDLPIILGAVLILGVSGAIIYFRAAPAVHDMIHTAYPGTVRSNSPASFTVVFREYLNAFSQYTTDYVRGNLCEDASFFSFFPMGILLCIFGMIRNRKADVFSIVMMALSAFFAVFAFLPVPEALRKITLMSFSMSSRIVPWFSFTQAILFFRGVSLLKGGTKWQIALPASALFAFISVYLLRDASGLNGNILLLCCMSVVLFIILWTAFRAGKDERACRTFSTIIAVFSLFTAGTVNPIQRGMAEIDNSAIVREIRTVTEKDPTGKWLVEGLGYPYGMIPLMGGAPTINCINNYPNMELWRKLDPEGDDEFAYNRYVSQINTIIVRDEPTTLSVGVVDDLMDARIQVDDLKKMEVSYILTNRALEELSTEDIRFENIASASMFMIYRVKTPQDEPQ